MPRVSRYYDVKRDHEGKRYLEVNVTGFSLLHLPLLNKSTGFTPEERRLLGLEGLVPPHMSTLEEQKERTYRRYRLQPTDLERHVYLRNLQDRNEVLFYAMLEDHLEEMLPILYTPTVGEAVRVFSDIYRYPRGFTVSTEDIDRVEDALDNVPLDDVRMIVATDSSAILGIGDQGFGGMAISIGKLSLYTVAGGVGPDKTLPVELDVGTDRQDLIDDPLYLGVHHRRLTGEAYDEFLDRFVEAVAARYPKAIIQWEDFARGTAFKVLERYRKVIPSFNDDIQGTGAMALAGLMNAARLKGEAFTNQVFVVVGAGAGGIGVAWAIRQGLVHAGMSAAEAAARVYVVDRQGLLMHGQSLEAHQEPFAKHPDALADWTYAGEAPTLLETIQNARATALLGLSGVSGLFTQPIITALLQHTPRPVVFPLSNPTSNVEVLPEEVVRWTDGQAIIASGSPFADIHHGDAVVPVGQGNNAFIFPGLGFGAVISGAREITDGMVMEAARTLADVTDVSGGRVYPPIRDLREVSIQVAVRVARQAIREGVAAERRVRNLTDDELLAFVRRRFWTPKYLPYRKAPDAR
ncbi:NAD-dependent malic enzyme [Deinococcus maricopensis]|uniref:Malic protein NAD-binding protein n=1 Tax=Deinococcus maricopensis (strain DSM 21211 / LMG 22137 / NRRL B-23946 / LB-34) TaxID=709986 RepID=E8U6U2_DEIML|nr:NAD-dependent malic enzyme [Deinococcus maricopensis]ADV66781.1 malic protein NAD-binding protein [Deinococcus maricopensis DSM 21211]